MLQDEIVQQPNNQILNYMFVGYGCVPRGMRYSTGVFKTIGYRNGGCTGTLSCDGLFLRGYTQTPRRGQHFVHMSELADTGARGFGTPTFVRYTDETRASTPGIHNTRALQTHNLPKYQLFPRELSSRRMNTMKQPG